MGLLFLWTYRDAQVKSEQSASAWALAALLIPNAMGFVAYLLIGRTKKDVPAPGTHKKKLIASLVVFVISIVFFVFGTLYLAHGDWGFGGIGTMNSGVWFGRTVNARGEQWAERVRRGNGISRRTVTLSQVQLDNFHVDSTNEEGLLYLRMEQTDTHGTRTFSEIDISGNFHSYVYFPGFEPGRVRMTLVYDSVRHSQTIITWRTPPELGGTTMNYTALSTINIGVNRPSDFDGDIVRLVLMIVLPIVLVQLILLITAIISLVKKQVSTEDKLLWGAIIVFISIIGPIIYFAIGSNMLEQKAATIEDSNNETERRQQ